MPIIRKLTKLLICLVLTLVLAGCRSGEVPASSPKPWNENYLDVLPGWRLRVVAPILKPETALQLLVVEPTSTGALQAKAASNFLGFETQYYSVTKSGKNGTKVSFASNEMHLDQPAAKGPLRIYFPHPPKTQRVRLVYLLRASQTEHDMAVLWAATPVQMEARWRQLESAPANCENLGNWCYWIPHGIAVIAEKQKPDRAWTPVQ